MPNYIEYIKVGGGESWPVRDTDAHIRLDSVDKDVTTINEDLTGLHEDLTALNERVDNMADDTAYLPLSGGFMTGPVDMGENTIGNLASPTDDQDAATKKYVDDSRAISHQVNVEASVPVSLSMVAGDVADFTYVTSSTDDSDIILHINESIATHSYYHFTGNAGNIYRNGFIGFSGNKLLATIQGQIRIVGGQICLTSHDIRGNGTGLGQTFMVCTNVDTLESLTFNKPGVLIYTKN